MESLKNKVIFITGASRGIGFAIALRAAQDGAKIVITGKTIEKNPKLPGTIFTAAEEIKKAGGIALPIAMDVRFEDQVQSAIAQTIKEFGGIDIVVNNASAIALSSTEATEMKRFDLMMAVNVRGTFLTSKLALPHLKLAKNPHILTLSPPLNLDSSWFEPHLAYTISKYGMSMCVLGMAKEFAEWGIGVNAIWPHTTINTAATQNLLGGKNSIRHTRKPEIVADAAHWILIQPAKSCTGNFFIDENIILAHISPNLCSYAVDPQETLYPDFFLDRRTGLESACDDKEEFDFEINGTPD